jgi:hypothetical protein
LKFAADVQAVIETSPLAQFKHLPAMAALNATSVATTTGPPADTGAPPPPPPDGNAE